MTNPPADDRAADAPDTPASGDAIGDDGASVTNDLEALRAELEAHQLKATLLEAGAEVTGYLYIKSKKGGQALAGGYIVTPGQQRFGF